MWSGDDNFKIVKGFENHAKRIVRNPNTHVHHSCKIKFDFIFSDANLNDLDVNLIFDNTHLNSLLLAMIFLEKKITNLFL